MAFDFQIPTVADRADQNSGKFRPSLTAQVGIPENPGWS
jgi:hypothetical protein